jgi:signal transduction histidine kinase
MTAGVSRSPAGPTVWSPSEQVRRTLFRILAVLRVILLAYAVVVDARRIDEVAMPGLVWAGLALMAGWSLVANVVYEVWRRRPLWFFVLDVAVACGVLLLSPTVLGEEVWAPGEASVPTFWVVGAVLAVAVGLGWWQGVLASLCVTGVELAVRVETTSTTWANIFLLTMAAAAVGFMATTLCRSAEARAAAERLRATLQERARLARVVHDGVLQVLAMVQRRAQDDADLAELGRLAAQQESSLRALGQYDARAAAASLHGITHAPETDLVHALEQVVGMHSLSGPGTPVRLPEETVTELAAAVSECLLNVARHVGEHARAWVLVEDLDDEVVVTVRDEGPGIATDRLSVAAAEGRIGVSGSIMGRLRDLGGRAELTTGPTIGTEWELYVPRTAPERRSR